MEAKKERLNFISVTNKLNISEVAHAFYIKHGKFQAEFINQIGLLFFKPEKEDFNNGIIDDIAPVLDENGKRFIVELAESIKEYEGR